MATLRVVDIETTGLAPPAEIIEIGRIDIIGSEKGWLIQQPLSQLYRPINGIPPETKAVHHITEHDLPADLRVCTQTDLALAMTSPSSPDAFVAHNCAFERLFIDDNVTGGLPWICTHKCALRLWPEAPGHSNQVLRYWRGHNHDPMYAMPPHRAAPDAFVTAHLLWDMLSLTNVGQLIQWTEEPKLLLKVPFGKHRGALWSDVPIDYLAWVTRQADMDADVLWNVDRELKRRS